MSDEVDSTLRTPPRELPAVALPTTRTISRHPRSPSNGLASTFWRDANGVGWAGSRAPAVAGAAPCGGRAMPARQTWDVVIVGAGAAGCVLASRLAARGERSILLLE